MIENNDIETLNILCSMDVILSNKLIMGLYSEFHQNLIYRATFKFIDWLDTKFNVHLPLRLHRVNHLGNEKVHFTLRCRTFTQSLFFNIEFNQDGTLEFSNESGFNLGADFSQEIINEYQKIVA